MAVGAEAAGFVTAAVGVGAGRVGAATRVGSIVGANVTVAASVALSGGGVSVAAAGPGVGELASWPHAVPVPGEPA